MNPNPSKKKPFKTSYTPKIHTPIPSQTLTPKNSITNGIRNKAQERTKKNTEATNPKHIIHKAGKEAYFGIPTEESRRGRRRMGEWSNSNRKIECGLLGF